MDQLISAVPAEARCNSARYAYAQHMLLQIMPLQTTYRYRVCLYITEYTSTDHIPLQSMPLQTSCCYRLCASTNHVPLQTVCLYRPYATTYESYNMSEAD